MKMSVGAEVGVVRPTLLLKRALATNVEDLRLMELLHYLDKLKNFEKIGMPKDSGTDSVRGLDLGRMKRLMDRLGNPQCNYQNVHIAGTKGKGSTAAILSNILHHEGYVVGCYSSPHIRSIRERITLGNSGSISSEVLTDIYHEVKQTLDMSIILENMCLSHFEVLTALAFALFAKHNVEIAVIEAGLGGERDATNILSSSEVAASIITTISEEHLNALGGSLESIATAKSGIIKCRRPVVLGGPFKPDIESILLHQASSLHSPVISGCDPRINKSIKYVYREKEKLYQVCDLAMHTVGDFRLDIELKDVKMQMVGNHQLQNAVTAVCTALCLRHEGWKISDGSIRAGLEKTCLPGRSQILSGGETDAIGLTGGSILVDGAHTEESARCLVDTVQMLHSGGPVGLVVAMAKDKDHVGFARQLLSGIHPQVVLLTEVGIGGAKIRTLSSSLLKKAWLEAAAQLGVFVRESSNFESGANCPVGNMKDVVMLSSCHTDSVKDSVAYVVECFQMLNGSTSGLVVVTGSLHLCAL